MTNYSELKKNFIEQKVVCNDCHKEFKSLSAITWSFNHYENGRLKSFCGVCHACYNAMKEATL